MRITQLECQPVTVNAPGKRIALTDEEGTHPLNAGFRVLLHTDEGMTGVGFTLSDGLGVDALRSLLEHDLIRIVSGEDPLCHEKLWAKMQQATRRIGFRGLVARAYAAIDIALWDIKAKVANLPLWRLLGGTKPAAPVFLRSREGVAAAKRAVKLGVMGVLLELGGCDPEADADLVQETRGAIGESGWLSVSAEGKYDLSTALALAHFFEEEIEVDWFEEPLPLWDHAGYARLAARVEQTISIGPSLTSASEAETWARGNLVRVLRPDVLQLGGLTPWLKLAASLEHQPVTLSPARFPELGVHLVCALPIAQAVELMPNMEGLFGELPRIEQGRMIPPMTPGIGLSIPSP